MGDIYGWYTRKIKYPVGMRSGQISECFITSTTKNPKVLR